MKTLLILRHAKSSWKDTDMDDHERPLNKRGKNDAPKMGRLLRDEKLLPDLIISSSAKRCRKTTEHILHASGYRGETRISSDVYEANVESLTGLLSKVNDQVGRLLIIGHNPGLEELLESLIGVYTPLSTAALAHVELAIDSWAGLKNKSAATLVKAWQPRELED